MSLAVEQRPAQPHVGSVSSYEQQMRYPQQPTFTNPWTNSTTSTSPTSATATAPSPYQPMTAASRASSVSMPYAANPAASSLGSSEQQLDPRLGGAFDLETHIYPDLVPTRSYESQQYSSAPPQSAYPAYGATVRTSPEAAHQTTSPYGYDAKAYDADISRRSSYAPDVARPGYNDALDASRGMLAMSQGQDMATPRQVYGGAAPGRQASHDAYGFPGPHSHHSSISSASTYPGYYNGSYSGSVDGSSATDYSSASDDPMGQRTLPAPSQLMTGYPPEPQSMMTSFNSKMSPNAQKKHKCKICEKRFTRPSSLQTHMYSHTGEKPFACDHEGCGRHFSVVSNLRRHKKVHKDEGAQDTASAGDE